MPSEWIDEEYWPGPSEWHDLYILPKDAATHTRDTQVAYLITDFGELTFKEFLYRSGIDIHVHAYEEKLGTYVWIEAIDTVKTPGTPSYIRVECSYVCVQDEAVVCGLPYLYTIGDKLEEWPPTDD